MGVGQAGVNFFDALDREHIACGRAGEFVRAVAGADGNGQGIELGGLHELGGFFGVGQHLAVVEFAHGPHAVFFPGFTGFQAAQATEFALHGGTNFVGHGHHFLGDAHVVVKVGRGFAIGQQAAVHHHRAKAQLQSALADGGAGAVVLVHHQRNVGIGFGGGQDQVLDEGFTSVFAGTGAGLQDDGGTHFIGRGHDGLHLLEVVHVESGNAVAGFGGVVEHFAHGNQRHGRVRSKKEEKKLVTRLVTRR